MQKAAEQLKALSDHENAFLRSKYPEHPDEFDTQCNDVSREKIRLYAEIHQDQKCYLGKVNRYSEDEGKPYLVEYTGQMIYNFEYKFMIPVYDQKLIDMIIDRESAEYTGTAEDYKRVSAIMNRIEEIGGIYLIWV